MVSGTTPYSHTGRNASVCKSYFGTGPLIVEAAVDLLGWERETLVFGVPGLSADTAFVLPRRRWWLGGLDDIGGRRLGRGGGILACRSELLLQLSDGGLEAVELRLLGVELRLQPLTVRTRRCGFGIHGRRFYQLHIGDTTP